MRVNVTRLAQMQYWSEIRTAYIVAKRGTVSAAADELALHRVTVMRQIDKLEAMLGVKLFQRHARGYTPTEVGQDLLRIGQEIDDQIHSFVSRTKGGHSELTGELIITSLDEISPKLLPSIAQFQAKYPQVKVRFVTSNKLFRLETGEAHIAVRAGPKPDEPDNIVQLLFEEQIGAFAHKDFAETVPPLSSIEELNANNFAALDIGNAGGKFGHWVHERVQANNFKICLSNQNAVHAAIRAGIGIGFISTSLAKTDKNLVEVLPSDPEWKVPFWVVTHVDLHRTRKIQSFLSILKSNFGSSA